MFVNVTHPGDIVLPKKAKLKLTVDGTEHACQRIAPKGWPPHFQL